MSSIARTGYHPMLLLAGRSLLATLFLVAGIRKALTFAVSAAYFTRLGFPLPEVMVVVAIIIEVGCALLLIAGWKTRSVAWLLALFVLIATFMGHRFWEFEPAYFSNQLNHFLKNFAVIGGLMLVAAAGPGSASVEKA